tara:strand:+ start:844 stop:1173 length:330 start_codon:yes stop_codon:yes gene_type:complete
LQQDKTRTFKKEIILQRNFFPRAKTSYFLIKQEVTNLVEFKVSYLIAFIRADKRDNLREAVFLLKTPFETPRINSGCAARNASSAPWASELDRASSTFLMKVRMRDLRA